MRCNSDAAGKHNTPANVYPLPIQTPTAPPQVRDLPLSCRPRELAQKLGMKNIEDYALIAIVLGSGTHGRSVVDMARGLLIQFGSLHGIAQADTGDLRKVRGMGPARIQALQAAFELGMRLTSRPLAEAPKIGAPEDVADLLREEARLLDCEHFWILNLDAKNRLKGAPVRVTTGTLNASLVHPREVFRIAIHRGAAAVLVAHNHPSGDPSPSQADINVTNDLIAAGRALQVQVLDHVILGRRTTTREKDFLSLRESGMVLFSE